MIGISVIVPTYNERENVTGIVERCLGALGDYDVEVVVVDDDSPDRTWAAAREAYREDDRVRVLRRVDERGLATAVARGFRVASREYCAVIDADFQHPPEKLPALLEALEAGADVAVGSRHVEGGGIENWSWARTVVSEGATVVAKTFVPAVRGLSDPMSGFFAVRRDVVADVELSPTGYKILLEILAKGEYGSVVEVPYVFTERERGESKLTLEQYWDFLEHCMLLAVVSYGLDDVVEPARVIRATEFAAVGVLALLVNLVAFVAAVGAGVDPLLAGVGTFPVAAYTAFLGNWAITFDRRELPPRAIWGTAHAIALAGLGLYAAVFTVGLQVVYLPAVLANTVAVGTGFVVAPFGFEQLVADPTADEEAPTSSTSMPSSD